MSAARGRRRQLERRLREAWHADRIEVSGDRESVRLLLIDNSGRVRSFIELELEEASRLGTLLCRRAGPWLGIAEQ